MSALTLKSYRILCTIFWHWIGNAIYEKIISRVIDLKKLIWSPVHIYASACLRQKLQLNEKKTFKKSFLKRMDQNWWRKAYIDFQMKGCDYTRLLLCPLSTAILSQRNVLNRILIYAGAVCCLPIILLLARCLSSEIQPQPRPRTVFRYAAQSTAAYRAQPQLVPQPPPRHPVPLKRSTSSHKGNFVACNTVK